MEGESGGQEEVEGESTGAVGFSLAGVPSAKRRRESDENASERKKERESQTEENGGLTFLESERFTESESESSGRCQRLVLSHSPPECQLLAFQSSPLRASGLRKTVRHPTE